MEKNIIFSVIIPTYQSEKYLPKVLDSLNRQTFISFEIIIIDDFSQDNTSNIVLKFQKESNLPVKYIKLNKNNGPSHARNLGWEMSSGVYICFLDSDDFWHTQKLEIVYFFLKKYSPEVLFDKYNKNENNIYFDLNNLSKPNYISLFKILIKNRISTPCLIIKREISERFDEKMKFCEDHDFILRLSEKYKILEIPFELSFQARKTEGNNLSSQKLNMRLGELKTYWRFCVRKNIFLFPFLAIFSILKHLIKISKNRIKFLKAV